jgi:hypothetical protein
LAARHLVERGLQLARGKLPAGLDLLAAFPPIGVAVVKDVLWLRLSLTEIRRFFFRRVG